jgi:hypothetical protein
MDILAAIFAYLGCVTGIVCALALSFTIYFSPHDHSAGVNPVSAVNGGTIALKVAPPKAPATTVAQVAPAAPAAKAEPQAVASAEPAAAATSKAGEPIAQSLTRRKALASRAQTFRRVVEEQRARRFAYQQDPDFEARFLGYAD